jgi:hypothetical protein
VGWCASPRSRLLGACATLQVKDHRRVVDERGGEGEGGEGRIGIGVEFVGDQVLIRKGRCSQEQEGRLEYRSSKSEDQ